MWVVLYFKWVMWVVLYSKWASMGGTAWQVSSVTWPQSVSLASLHIITLTWPSRPACSPSLHHHIDPQSDKYLSEVSAVWEAPADSCFVSQSHPSLSSTRRFSPTDHYGIAKANLCCPKPCVGLCAGCLFQTAESWSKVRLIPAVYGIFMLAAHMIWLWGCYLPLACFCQVGVCGQSPSCILVFLLPCCCVYFNRLLTPLFCQLTMWSYKLLCFSGVFSIYQSQYAVCQQQACMVLQQKQHRNLAWEWLFAMIYSHCSWSAIYIYSLLLWTICNNWHM